MNHLQALILGYVALINLVTFVAYGIDKRKARRDSWRIPERTLLLLAVFGGSVGALLAMRVFHHKTKHRKFTILVPLILVLQLALAAYLFYLRHPLT